MLPFTPQDLDTVTVISLENTAGVTPHSVDECSSSSWIVATLSVTGPWECHIEVAVDADLAAQLTKLMWDQDSVERDEVFDAVGEIANVIAGGIKGRTPSPGCGLTLPVVDSRAGLEALTNEHIRRYFTVMNRPVAVTTSL